MRLALFEISFWRNGFGYGQESYLLWRMNYWMDSHLYSFHFSYSPYYHAAKRNADMWQSRNIKMFPVALSQMWLKVLKRFIQFLEVCDTGSIGEWLSVYLGELSVYIVSLWVLWISKGSKHNSNDWYNMLAMKEFYIFEEKQANVILFSMCLYIMKYF